MAVSYHWSSALLFILQYVVELKVGMHCDRCIKSIKKAIKTIDDMESYQLEKETNKVTVTGNITPEEVVKALQKIGKTVTYWGE
ncbi:copper transport protein CCH [Hordeum vulgare]|nr:copper transport protein CCH [Hordeum vulgare]